MTAARTAARVGMIVFLIIGIFGLLTCRAEEITFQWTPNTEQDLAGYRLYMSETPDGQEIGGEFMAEIPAGTETVTITDAPATETTHYYIMTAYDIGGRESGKSNEVSHFFDRAPMPPQGVQKVNVTANNIIINGDVNIASATIGGLRLVKE